MPPSNLNLDPCAVGRALRVFLCHASADKPTVREIYMRLLIPGIDPWLDEEKLLAGQDWDREIKKAVRNSDIVIVCLSRSSVAKEGYVQKELHEALDIAQEKPEGTVFLVPIKLEECDIPTELRSKQWVNYFDDHGHEKLMRAITDRANKLGCPLQPLPLTPQQSKAHQQLNSGAETDQYYSADTTATRATSSTKPVPIGFVVRRPFPDNIAKLNDLSQNLLWAWHPEISEVFRMLDPELWHECRHNPITLLNRISSERLQQASNGRRFLEAYAAACRTLDLSSQQVRATNRPVALFCLEYGLIDAMAAYAGGLGVLAGDQLKVAADCGTAIVGVGLLYRLSYFRQRLNPDGWQHELYPATDVEALPIKPVRDGSGRAMKLQITLSDGPLLFKVWRMAVGGVPLYLLDCDLPENSPEYKDLTSSLYSGDIRLRIRQEMLLGVGGFRALKALGIEPDVFHLNESSAAFLAIERIQTYCAQHSFSFLEALEAVRATTVYTTHTPVPAGVDMFSFDLVKSEMRKYVTELGLELEDVLRLGQDSSSPDRRFSMLALAMRTSAQRNAVSPLHRSTCQSLWNELWPGVPPGEVPIKQVISGVHLMSWLNRDLTKLYDEYLEPDWRDHSDAFGTWRPIDNIPADELIEMRDRARRRLVNFIHTRLANSAATHPAYDKAIAFLPGSLDSRYLTIGFGRRFANYKRPSLLLHDLERLKRLVSNDAMPIQVIVAGKAHPKDPVGKTHVREIVKVATSPEFRGRIVFLEDYDLETCRHMVQGADVWLVDIAEGRGSLRNQRHESGGEWRTQSQRFRWLV